MTGVPTAISKREAACLQRWARDRIVIEAGALLGYSTIKMARTATRVVSIDRHSGYSGETERRFRSNLQRFIVPHRHAAVDVKVGDCFELLPLCSGDFTFIDLTGSYEDTLKALLMAPSRLIGVHDTRRFHCRGVERAIEASGYPALEQVETLTILERSPRWPLRFR